ncbi:MAG: hypothetical protein ACT4TC_16750 [Myxococcaceae bacterium]
MIAACSQNGSPTPPDDGKPRATLPAGAEVIAASEQRAGDPAKGYLALLNNPYVSCGVPAGLFRLSPQANQAFDPLEGRQGANQSLPPEFTSVTTPSGVEVVSANCLTCHGGKLEGRYVVGLGNSTGDFTSDPSPLLKLAIPTLINPLERAELQKLSDRLEAIAPYTTLDTVGVNPATTLTYALFAHHEVKTLAWSNTPLEKIPDAPTTPADVPPWWHMKKKNAMFHVAGGRGDHSRFMMAASTLCVESNAEAQKISEYFGDIRAYISSIQPPPYPGQVDATQATTGREVFERMCSVCHGTYGEGGSYPNVLIPLQAIGTDTLLADEALYTKELRQRFQESFYGQGAQFAPAMGYVAPPLDGVWASGPYLHNGSIPTVAAVLDSSIRPKFWKRTSGRMDLVKLGITATTLAAGKSGELVPSRRKYIYDTTQVGYGNGGHTFGDSLTAQERSDVIEYLKTL